MTRHRLEQDFRGWWGHLYGLQLGHNFLCNELKVAHDTSLEWPATPTRLTLQQFYLQKRHKERCHFSKLWRHAMQERFRNVTSANQRLTYNVTKLDLIGRAPLTPWSVKASMHRSQPSFSSNCSKFNHCPDYYLFSIFHVCGSAERVTRQISAPKRSRSRQKGGGKHG